MDYKILILKIIMDLTETLKRINERGMNFQR